MYAFGREHKPHRLSYFLSLLSGEVDKLLTICKKLYIPIVSTYKLVSVKNLT